MPKDFERSRRVADVIQQEIVALIRHEVKDPRVEGLLTVTDVEVSSDLSQAKVYITQLDGDVHEAVEALNNAAGFLRKELGRRVKLRIVPYLKFFYDESIERGASMASLIQRARQSDTDGDSDV